MSFRKRKFVEVVPDTFNYEVSETGVRDLHGVQTTFTTRRRVSSLEHVFKPVPPMPPLSEQLKAGVSLKEVPTDGILDSNDNLDYETDGIEERLIKTLEKSSKRDKKPKAKETTQEN